MAAGVNLHSTDAALGIVALVVFVVAYLLVMGEEFIHLRKSKPVILAAGIIWVCCALLAQQKGVSADVLKSAINHNLEEFSSLLLCW